MSLLQLDVARFRCIEQAQLKLDPKQNLIIGPNASGKTSLLEAAYLLGCGHSFRTHHAERLIRHGAESFITVGQLNTANRVEVIGLQGWKEHKEGRINGEGTKSLAELATRFPVQCIDPDVHQLLEEGPGRRRQYLDWGVFHVEHQFHEAWRRYQRALRQRNAALKACQSERAIKAWDQDLVEQGNAVARFRESYLLALQPFASRLGQELMRLPVLLEHQQGWQKTLSFEAALNEAWPRDQLRGSTSVGPHRADVLVKVDEQPAKERISRGQQKLLACCLILAQQAHRAAIGAPPACLLLDDPAAELDVDNLGKLLRIVAEMPTQLIVTGLDTQVLNFFPHARLFHVEHGIVQPMA